MKQLLSYLTVCAILLAQLPLAAQNFTCTPEKPIPGETLTIYYNPAGSPLDGLESFDAVAYLFDFDQNDMPIASEISMKKEGEGYIGTVATTRTAKAVLFGFENLEADKSDNNGDKGFKVLFYQNDRNNPVPGALATKSMIYGGYGYMGGVKTDREKALSLMQKEFAANPASKLDKRFYGFYASVGSRLKNDEIKAEVKARVAEMTSGKKVTEDQYFDARGFLYSLGEQDEAKAMEAKMREKYPKGKSVMYDLMNSFNESKDLKEQVALFEKLKKNYGTQKEVKDSHDRFAGRIASGYAKQDDWANFDKYLAMMSNKPQIASNLNNLAWTMSGESIEAEGKELAKAKAYSARSLELVQAEMANPTGKQVSQTARQFKHNLGFSLGMYADTYALLAYKTGDKEAALKYQQMSCDQNKFGDGEMNERYCVYLESVKGGQEAEKMLSKFIVDGKATSKMKEQHKRLFLANNTMESAYDKYVVQLEKEALANKREELKEKMLDQAAPGFKLVNLNGEEVSLASLKGKVVVVDFWATWCGPCKASFPGMQKAVNKFADSKDVAFVFIDTWENADDKEKNAADFIASKQYTFNVLMDNEDKTVAAFGVSGIPTKFVIDKNGNIRFKSVGFNGNDEELVNELTMMIELAGGSVPVAMNP
jgi:thiol-disulfide isomerase/thioredoxin